jgi:hypothetical protein
MANSRIGIPGTNQFLDSTNLTSTVGAVEREGVFVGDPSTFAARAAVKNQTLLTSEYGLVTRPIFNPAMFDAFGRLRTSDPVTIFDSSQEYSYHPLLFEHYVSGTGTTTHSTTRNSTTISTGGTSVGARAFRGSKVYWRYQPGKSQLVKITSVPLSGGSLTDVAMVIRSNVSGSVMENRVQQASWNIDPMEGAGQSGITLDPTKNQIFVIDLQWLAVGRVRTGFQIGGALWYVHEFTHANTATGAYMRTANLPVRWEVVNTADGPRVRIGYFDDDNGVFFEVQATGTISCETICVEIESEGGQQDATGYTFRAGTAGTQVACANSATLTPVFSIRLRDTFNSLTYRGHVKPSNLEALVSTNACYYEVVLNATLTGATFANNAESTYSGVEYDTAATAYSGGTVIESGYFGAGAGSARLGGSTGLSSKLLLARTYANVRDTLTFVARGVSGTSNVALTLDFTEVY